MAMSADNVMFLLSSLGFDDGQLGSESKIVIERFDQWTNADTAAVLTLTCVCGITVDYPAKTAA